MLIFIVNRTFYSNLSGFIKGSLTVFLFNGSSCFLVGFNPETPDCSVLLVSGLEHRFIWTDPVDFYKVTVQCFVKYTFGFKCTVREEKTAGLHHRPVFPNWVIPNWASFQVPAVLTHKMCPLAAHMPLAMLCNYRVGLWFDQLGFGHSENLRH